MPVFTKSLPDFDLTDIKQALRATMNHIRTMQEELEYKLSNLDSQNVTEISTDVTKIMSSDGGVSITGEEILLTGKNKEKFRAGLDSATGLFRFEVADTTGNNVIYLSSTGEIVITKMAALSIDCGEW